jgi:phosphotransferase system  glucose/maltose/N-acetylglucosamine-specific IIC component
VTICANVTLAGLSYGVHTVTVFAWYVAGNAGASETVYFSVEETDPFPTMIVIAPVASVAVLGVGLAVYFKRRKHQAGTVEV